MIGLSGIRLYGAIAGLVALLAAGAWLVSLVRDRDALAAVKARGVRCEAAIKAGADPVADCPQAISDAATRAQRYLACDAALATPDLYIVRAACSANVKRRDAEASVALANLADARAELASARDDLAGAVSRADARATALNRKDRHAQAAIASAPKTVDGRIACDAACLRDIAGE